MPTGKDSLIALSAKLKQQQNSDVDKNDSL